MEWYWHKYFANTSTATSTPPPTTQRTASTSRRPPNSFDVRRRRALFETPDKAWLTELNRYLEEKFTDVDDPDIDVVAWWQVNPTFFIHYVHTKAAAR
jgi:hypothetical protein